MNRGGTKRHKGGAEKKREKLKRALLSGGKKCAKLDVFFSSTATSTSSASIDVGDTGEEGYDEQEQNEQKEDEQDKMDTQKSQWEQGRTPPWLARRADGRSSASSGAESDSEGSSSGTERPSPEINPVTCSRTRSRAVLHPPQSLSRRMGVNSKALSTQRRITELNQQKEELKIELQLEIALLQGELQTERERLRKHTAQLQMLQESKHKPTHSSTQQERVKLEEERLRVEDMKARWMEREKLTGIDGQRDTDTLLQIQQEKEVLDSAVRAFEDWEFRVLEMESSVEEEKMEGETDREISREQHAMNTAQERVRQLEQQLKDMEREKEREMSSLREEKRELLHQTHRILKENKLVADWPNITGSASSMASLSPLTNHKTAQDVSSSARRRSSHRKVTERPTSVQGLIRNPDTPPLPHSKHRLSNGNANGFHTPTNSTCSSRAASPNLHLVDLVEIERKLREAKAERERLLKEREERRRLTVEDGHNKPDDLNTQPHTNTHSEEEPKEIHAQNSPEHGVPLFLTLNFDLRAHVENLGHGVAGCLGVRLTPRRCCGFLTKRGGRVKTWRRRWFLFDMDHRRLAYYTDQDERKLKGVIYFQAIEEVYYDHLRTATTSPRPSLTFCVKTYERLFFLVALSAESMRIWMDVIVTATDEHSRY
ncbi:pleckstrin homology-like domain family B member 3 isoform X2 [Neoarius graeffei]|uniref:pleckstrin homology-like domain family B member 3 isoform X2 n=1 Tax=Neoarius graeffei TaxID=443677 RepID=UPI00298D329A|nr:pleckstrin homology-like domain family B member 3 isoform X2 [Neoarius graeffei]